MQLLVQSSLPKQAATYHKAPFDGQQQAVVVPLLYKYTINLDQCYTVMPCHATKSVAMLPYSHGNY